MSLLSEYEERTAWKYEPIRGYFHTHEGLERKIAPDGSCVPFAGSTVVFRPGKDCLRTVILMQEALLYRLKGTGMAASLPASTIHMTLHDLVSPEMCFADPGDTESFRREAVDSLDKASAFVGEIRKEYAACRIEMVPDRIVNMMSKSLVLMLRPRTERDFETLLAMYRRFDEIRSLPYPLTPHITLMYYVPGMLDGDRLGEAVAFAQPDPEKSPVFTFCPEGLTAQHFLDMRTYMDIPQKICVCCDGGMVRSVMAANILNRLAEKRGLPIAAQARSAFRASDGRPIPERVWDTLEKNGIPPDRTFSCVRCLEDAEISHFTCFAPVSPGASDRLARLALPAEKTNAFGECFFGVRDPEYADITYEQVFAQLRDRAEKALDAFEKEYEKHMGDRAPRTIG